MTPKQHLDSIIKSSGLSRRKWYHTVYLYSRHWKDLREAKFRQAGKKCKTCGGHYKLQCHHLKYRSIYNVTLDDLEVLCENCHVAEHRKLKKERKQRRAARDERRALEITAELDSAFNRIEF